MAYKDQIVYVSKIQDDLTPERVSISKHVGPLPPAHKEIGNEGENFAPIVASQPLEIENPIKQKIILSQQVI